MDPKRLGKYEIGAKIGQGAMGTVHRAHDPILNRDVAIKTMSAGVDSDDELRQRFHREAQSAARLNHPNIITVYDFGEEQGRMYIAMELLEGADLKEVITRQRPLSLDAKLDLMDKVCDGLAFAHARGVIHRDLKPANIHLQANGVVKIMDFGLARVSSSTELTGAGMLLGTPNYMAPEQVRGEKASTRSDVFSLGAVFYELLSGRKAFDADSMAGVLFQVMQKDPEPLDDIRAELGLVAAVIQRALVKDPKVRFAEASELRDALREARRSVRSEAIPPRPPLPRKAPGDLPYAAGTLVRPAADGALAAALQPAQDREPSAETAATPIPAVTRRPADTVPPSRPDPNTAQSPALETLTASGLEPTVATPRGAATTPPFPARETSGGPWPELQERAERPERAARPGRAERARPTTRGAPGVRTGLSAPIVLAGCAALGLAAGVATWLALRPDPPQTVPSTLAEGANAPPTTEPTKPPAMLPPTTIATTVPPDTRLADAERSVREKDYRAALATLEPLGPDHEGTAAAKRVATEARRALRVADLTAARFEEALLARDLEGASQALSSLIAEDPRRPDLAALADRLKVAHRRPTPATTLAVSTAVPPPTTLAPPVTTPPAPVTTMPVPVTTLPVPPTTTPARQSEAAARQAIRGVLDEYRAAFERRDADALRAVQPGIDYEAMKKTFASVTGYTVRVDVKEVTVQGDEGRASCVVTYQPQPKPAQKIPPQSTVFHLRRAGDLWLIERLERR